MENRIKEWRKNRGLTAEQLATMLGTGRSTIVKLENGQRRFTTTWMERIAKELKLTPAQLLSSDALNPVDQRMVSAPLIDWSCAWEYAGTVPKQHPAGAWEKAEFVPYPRDTVIALAIAGDDMDRIAPKGSTIIVDYADKTLRDGGCYLFAVGNEVRFRRYRDSGGPPRFEPASTNAEHQIFYPEKAQSLAIVGRVVKVTIDLEPL